MKLYGLVLSLGTMLVLGTSLQAGTVYDYAFGGLGGDLGSNTHAFAPIGGGPSIIATGYHVSGPINNIDISDVNLYSKGIAAFPPAADDENGLGLTNDRTGDGEVTPSSFIMLDLGNLASYKVTDLGVYTESTTDGEKWVIAGSNQTPFTATSTSQFQLLASGTSEGMQDLGNGVCDRYIYLSSLNGNVLFGGVAASVAAPEPSSFGLLGLALAGAGMLFRRRFSK